MRVGTKRAVASLLVLVAGCTRKPTNTGYVGTWSRGNPNAHSMISLVKSGDGYRFLWKLTSLDGRWTVTCDAKSHCVEIYDGKKITEYQFSTRVDAATGHLIIEGAQTSYAPDGQEKDKVVDVDELIVEDSGLKLGSYTIDRNGEKFDKKIGPQRHFDKVSDEVMELAP